MPRENKKRGRRAEASKRKADDIADIAAGEADASAKRQRRSPPREHLPFDDVNGFRDAQAAGQAGGDSEMPFYGLLDEQESEYFRRADDMLEANDFSDEEERSLFLENVYKEVDSKELKLACSQSSSRLLERLILLSTPAQLKKLFQKFSGQ
jgi:nucleolar protein 9